ncbi:MAG: T9SS type A sorting domain-containing protein [Dysgonamonadaceae bacterium]|jgi:hypothetical protein|nr:T9SS type A sorting domain-containing protein [Dysgonamonadaceae bacterium]
MGNRIKIILSLLLFFFPSGLSAQVSYGGKPLFSTDIMYPDNFKFKSSSRLFIDMPSFDLDSIKRNHQSFQRGYFFAHKFHTHIERSVDGIETILDDGTKVWRVGIKSDGAYSINLLFTEFEIPHGGKLFIYNINQSHIIGAFDYRNNSPEKILPVRPVAGDAIIVEYSEPADAEFEGKLVIGEVNHDYNDILRGSPNVDKSDYNCMPDALCSEADNSTIQSTVLLIINGNMTCTGTLVNNTNNDETPYILTAVHCLNETMAISRDMDFYIGRAGTIIAFFNYDRPVCGTKMKGTEEMSAAMTYPRVILEKNDIALLELQEKPPHYYNAYYAGWNIDSNGNNQPYSNLHHPDASVKKFGKANKVITLSSIPGTTGSYFDKLSHWKISSWNIGSTYAGSSGSPLFDRNNLIVGGLTGGSSVCNGENPGSGSDYFFALFKGWETDNVDNQLKTYLDPINTGVKQWSGLNPNEDNPFFKLSNSDFNSVDTLTLTRYEAPNNGYLFGNSHLNVLEFAEEFSPDSTSLLYGVYLLIPPMSYSYLSDVEITIYEGDDSPRNLLATQTFRPQYSDYSGTLGLLEKNKITNLTPTENFVLLDQPVYVGKHFFAGYKINYSENNRFAVYNSGRISGEKENTAWIKTQIGDWVTADNYSVQSVTTSLAIQALLQHTYNAAIADVAVKNKNVFTYNRQENQLYFPEIKESGKLFIYNLNGQLIQKNNISNGERRIYLQSRPKGSIAIVKFVSGNESFFGKIIY